LFENLHLFWRKEYKVRELEGLSKLEQEVVEVSQTKGGERTFAAFFQEAKIRVF